MSADTDTVESAVVFAVAMVSARGYVTLDAVVCITFVSHF